LSPAIKTDTIIFVSGQTTADAKGNFPDDVKQQTIIILDKIESLLREADSSMEK